MSRLVEDLLLLARGDNKGDDRPHGASWSTSRDWSTTP